MAGGPEAGPARNAATRWLALIVVALALAGCSRGASAPGPGARVATADGDGLHVELSLSTGEIGPKGTVHLVVTLRNDRRDPVTYSAWDCFAAVSAVARLPLEPMGRTWDGAAGAFKTSALANGSAAGGAMATDPFVIRLRSTACPGAEAEEASLAPGQTVQAEFDWRPEYVSGVPVVGQVLPIHAKVSYDRQNDAPSYPPDHSGPKRSWFPVYKELEAVAALLVDAGPHVLSLGEAIDASLADPTFRAFVESAQGASCQRNLYLSDQAGSSMGGAWWIEDICDAPRRFVIAAVDPVTGAIKRSDPCEDPCSR